MKVLFLSILAVLGSIFSSAQVTQGGLEGRLTGPEGSPIENASVLVTNYSLQSTKGITTHVDGLFTISGLPVGEYRLEISHVSYSGLVMDSIRVELGLSANLGEIKLQARSTDLEAVVVSADKYFLSSSAAIESNITLTSMNTLPIDRDFKSAITLLPQVNPSYYGDLPNMGGATGSENLLFIDGLNVTDNYDVSSSISLPYNFIKEIQVKQGGYEAQYGKTIGGLVNAVTQSGTNESKGQAFAFFTNSGLGQDPKTTGAPGSAVKDIANYDVGASFGGAIVKDKLWYFAAYSFNRKQFMREIVGHGYFQDNLDVNMFAGKLSWKASSKTDLSMVVLGDPSVHKQVKYSDLLGNGIPTAVDNTDAMLARYTLGGFYAILKGQTKINSTISTDYSLYGFGRRFKEAGTTDIGTLQPQYIDRLVPGEIRVSGGIGRTQDNDMTKIGISASVTKLIQSSTIKAGFLYEVNRVDAVFDITTPGQIIADSGPQYTGIEVDWSIKPKSINPAAYVQGNFKVSETLEVSSGLRWDGWFLYNGVEELQSMQLLQPRIGFSYFFGQNGNQKIFGNYGLIYQQIPLIVSVGYFTHLETARFYSSDPRNSGVAPVGQVYFAPTDKPDYDNNKDMKPDYSSEYVLGYETLVNPLIRLGLKGMYRRLESAVLTGWETTFADPDPQYFINGNAGAGALSFLPPAKRDYLALEFTVQGRDRRAKVNYNFSYVLSRNYGNYTGYFDQDLTRASQPGNSISYSVPEQAIRSLGDLPNDRRHMAKVFGSYSFNFGLTAGVSVVFVTGTPLNEYKVDSLIGFRPVFLKDRGTAGRLPNLLDVNLRLAYKPANLPGRLLLDFFHIGSSQQVTFQDQYKFFDSQETVLNPNFGKPISYQPPMFVRFGIEVDF